MINRTLRKLFNAQSPPPMIWEPQVHDRLYPDRPYFLTRVRQGINKLPIELQDKFYKRGHKLYVTRTLDTAAELLPLTKEHIQEDKGLDFIECLKDSSHCSGAYFKYDGHIVIPQSVDFISVKELLSLDIKYIVAHEAGHLFDFDGETHPLLSNSPEFIDIAIADLREASCAEIIKRTYNGKNIINALVDGNELLALQELFADLFAEAILGTNRMSRFTPNAARWVSKKIDEAVHDYRTNFKIDVEYDEFDGPIAA